MAEITSNLSRAADAANLLIEGARWMATLPPVRPGRGKASLKPSPQALKPRTSCVAFVTLFYFKRFIVNCHLPSENFVGRGALGPRFVDHFSLSPSS